MPFLSIRGTDKGEEKAEDSGTDDSKDSGAVSMGGVCQCLDNVDIILIVYPDSLIADRLSLRRSEFSVSRLCFV